MLRHTQPNAMKDMTLPTLGQKARILPSVRQSWVSQTSSMDDDWYKEIVHHNFDTHQCIERRQSVDISYRLFEELPHYKSAVALPIVHHQLHLFLANRPGKKHDYRSSNMIITIHDDVYEMLNHFTLCWRRCPNSYCAGIMLVCRYDHGLIRGQAPF